jgi:hypothetical protein
MPMRASKIAECGVPKVRLSGSALATLVPHGCTTAFRCSRSLNFWNTRVDGIAAVFACGAGNFPLTPFTNRDGIPNRNCTVLLVSIDV